MYPYRFQRVQELMREGFHLYVNIARWYFQHATVQPCFSLYMLFTNETTLTVTRPHAWQHIFSVNMWSGMVHDYVIGPYILSHHLDDIPHLLATGFPRIADLCTSVHPETYVVSSTMERRHILAVMSKITWTLLIPTSGFDDYDLAI